MPIFQNIFRFAHILVDIVSLLLMKKTDKETVTNSPNILGVSVDEMCPAGTFTYRTRLGGIVLLKDGNGALCDGCARHVHQLGIGLSKFPA